MVNIMKWIQYKIYTTTQEADIIGAILCEAGITGFEISDHIPPTPEEERQMFTDIPAILPPDDGSAVITFYTEGENPQGQKNFYSTGSSLRDERLEASPTPLCPEELISSLKQRMEELPGLSSLPEIKYSIEDDSQWKDSWKDSFTSFRIAGDIIVKPVWEDIPSFAKEGDNILQIEPGSAFGTGTHETTKLCLTTLRNYITPDTRLLDAGCGSGILALSALLLGASHAFCLDIDPSAIHAAQKNAEWNRIYEQKIQILQGDILSDTKHILSLCPKPFDIAVANILADVIIPLSNKIPAFLKKDGIFISSGILFEKADEVRQALSENHFSILEEHRLGEWVCFAAQKN